LPLVLEVYNPLPFRITVVSITTTVGNASSSCKAGYVRVAPFSGHLTVGAGRVSSTAVKVTMAHAAPDPCQGAFFPFEYRGLAEK
jgi:P pilus assembly chaperone PapD